MTKLVLVKFLESGLLVDEQVHAIPGSGAGALAERTNGRNFMKDPTVRGVGHLIEETKNFGPEGFRERPVPEQHKSAFTNSR